MSRADLVTISFARYRQFYWENNETEFLDIGDMAAAPSNHMFPRSCQKLNMPVGGT
jgi:hypothetical protein